jgi:hypothetical protein
MKTGLSIQGNKTVNEQEVNVAGKLEDNNYRFISNLN